MLRRRRRGFLSTMEGLQVVCDATAGCIVTAAGRAAHKDVSRILLGFVGRNQADRRGMPAEEEKREKQPRSRRLWVGADSASVNGMPKEEEEKREKQPLRWSGADGASGRMSSNPRVVVSLRLSLYVADSHRGSDRRHDTRGSLGDRRSGCDRGGLIFLCEGSQNLTTNKASPQPDLRHTNDSDDVTMHARISHDSSSDRAGYEEPEEPILNSSDTRGTPESGGRY